MKRKRILIVEDESIVALDIEMLLDRLGYQVIDTLSTGEEALDVLEREEIDLVLFDVMLAGEMNGIEAAEKSKSIASVPIIFLTANSNADMLARAKITEPYSYLFKPFDETELQIAIEVSLNNFSLQQEVREQYQMLKAVMNTVPHFIFWKDTDLRYKGCNERFAELAGYESSDNIVGKTDSDCPWPVEQIESFKKTDMEVISTGNAIFNVEESLGENEIVLLCSKVPMRDRSGIVSGVLGIFADITDLKAKEEELVKTKAELEQKAESLGKINNDIRLLYKELEVKSAELMRLNSLKTDFISMVSHEIRTPMNGILGFADLLTATGLDERQQDYVSTIVSSGKVLMRVIDDVLDVSQIESRKLRLEEVEFSLKEIIDETVKVFRRGIEDKGLELNCIIDEAIPQRLRGDPTRLKQIFFNLLSNAEKFTLEGKITFAVEQESVDASGNSIIKVVVEDTGIGMPDEAKATIFELFRQVDSSPSRRYGGNGLGLAIVASLVGMMHGEIEVTSEEDKGSSFTFRIVLAPAKSINQPMFRRGRVGDDVLKNFEGRRVLIVEDNKVNAELIAIFLRGWKMGVDKVVDGISALEKVGSNEYDIVFMDILMPGMDGYEISRRMRRDVGVKVPIVAVTGGVMKENKQKCFEAGMNDFVFKPVSATTLANVIAKWI